MNDTLIKVEDLCKIYNPGENEVRALDHVSLEIKKGELVAIIGQSGSGKSTFMNMLGCLDVPTSGKYYLNGTDVSEMTDNELSEVRNREIGFIFQGFNLIANLNAIENVELPLIYRGIDRKTRHELAIESLKMVGLEKRMDHKPSEMSGGQQQRVAIARAIAAQPPVILADEPTGNLDSASSKEILAILKKMHKTAQKMIRSAMLAFLEGKTNLKDDIMDFEESMHMLQNKSINIIATQMAENSFDEKERSNYFMYLFRVVKAFERIGDISIEIIDVAIEFHNNIPRSTTPRTFR